MKRVKSKILLTFGGQRDYTLQKIDIKNLSKRSLQVVSHKPGSLWPGWLVTSWLVQVTVKIKDNKTKMGWIGPRVDHLIRVPRSGLV